MFFIFNSILYPIAMKTTKYTNSNNNKNTSINIIRLTDPASPAISDITINTNYTLATYGYTSANILPATLTGNYTGIQR